jgi:hypothetical protein
MARLRPLATLLLLPLLQCTENSVTGPDIPDGIRANAIRLHVDVAARTVTQVGVPSSSGISFSLLGSEGVSVQASNFVQSPTARNKNLVQFDVAITNSLNNVTLIQPTLPEPPAGTNGLLLFPFSTTVVSGSGRVVASNDWDGAPFSFFNDDACNNSGSSSCFRWEEYAAPLAPGASSAAQTVGFEADKNVTSFEVVMLLAADLQNVPQEPASIVLSQTSASFQFSAGTGQTSDVQVTVSNGGGGTLSGLTTNVTYQAGQPTGWLVAHLSTTTAPSVLTFPLVPIDLSDGTYNATVAVASEGVSNSPQNVNVTLVVAGSLSSSAIYVSESDPTAIDDAGCGLGPNLSGPGNHPCRTIARGLFRANATGRPEIRVADGHYSEDVALVSGKSLLGGYQPDTWQRHVATTNTIIDGVSSVGNHDRTVVAMNLIQPTVFEGFVVRGAANSKLAGSSYAIYVSNSAGLTISRNAIYAGSGGPGPHAATGTSGSQGGDGIGRDSNPQAYDSKIATGTGSCDASNNRSYTNGAIGVVGADNISGGNGGGNSCPPSSTFTQQSALNGTTGFSGEAPRGGSAGTLGIGGLDFRLTMAGTICGVASSGSHAGANGGLGGNGQHGAAVVGASDQDGSVSSGHWVGAMGSQGQAGGNGGGGGGGGAGGGAHDTDAGAKHRLGGVGGGGGAGGAGGGGGGGGSAGGGSFGIFIVGPAPVVSDNSIYQGTGGNGGSGGAGATGALGGSGGAGGAVAVFCTEAGGRGGVGGVGGTGSGGGGGSGGASFGIYTSGAGTPNYCTPSANNPISGGAGGAGGQGGASQVNPGGAGVTGARATCSFQ